MRFYTCEIEHQAGKVNIAILKSEVLGISTKFYPGPNQSELIGFSKYGEYLYPVVTHSKVTNPILKYFLILPKYAFGVTRIIEEVEAETIQISPTVEISHGSGLESISEYTGIIQLSGEIYYVYNIHYVKMPLDAEIVTSEKDSPKTRGKEEIPNFLIIGEKYAVRKESVKTILQSDLVTPYKFHGVDGFVDYKGIIPVKMIDSGRFVVVLETEAYQTSKVRLSSGKILVHEQSGKKLVETDSGTYEMIE
ncbi:MAG: hypothetical protein N2Z58_06900 [Fervidobacterium sp.]|nr:hypothetical protein [Fervidobacterium sp.]